MPTLSMPSEATLLDFVAQSNAIEGEPTRPGETMFDDYMHTAQAVCERADAADAPLGPRLIHGMIMRSQDEFLPGQYRDRLVRVGDDVRGLPALVPSQMDFLIERARRACSDRDELALWDTHLEFESIHPFLDGNGRSGRLWLNECRLRAGLPWLTVRFVDCDEYFEQIRLWQRVQDAKNAGKDQDAPVMQESLERGWRYLMDLWNA